MSPGYLSLSRRCSLVYRYCYPSTVVWIAMGPPRHRTVHMFILIILRPLPDTLRTIQPNPSFLHPCLFVIKRHNRYLKHPDAPSFKRRPALVGCPQPRQCLMRSGWPYIAGHTFTAPAWRDGGYLERSCSGARAVVARGKIHRSRPGFS